MLQHSFPSILGQILSDLGSDLLSRGSSPLILISRKTPYLDNLASIDLLIDSFVLSVINEIEFLISI